MLVHSFTLDILNVIAATGSFNITCESPLTYTPHSYLTHFTISFMTWHTARAPVWLHCNFAEIPSSSAAKIDADMVRSSIVLLVDAITWASVATESLKKIVLINFVNVFFQISISKLWLPRRDSEKKLNREIRTPQKLTMPGVEQDSNGFPYTFTASSSTDPRTALRIKLIINASNTDFIIISNAINDKWPKKSCLGFRKCQSKWDATKQASKRKCQVSRVSSWESEFTVCMVRILTTTYSISIISIIAPAKKNSRQ